MEAQAANPFIGVYVLPTPGPYRCVPFAPVHLGHPNSATLILTTPELAAAHACWQACRAPSLSLVHLTETAMATSPHAHCCRWCVRLRAVLDHSLRPVENMSPQSHRLEACACATPDEAAVARDCALLWQEQRLGQDGDLSWQPEELAFKPEGCVPAGVFAY